MVTVGPGSNATTSWRAVSYNRIKRPPSAACGCGIRRFAAKQPLSTLTRSLRSLALDIEAGEPDRGARLVAHVDLQEHSGEGLDRRGRRQRPCVHRAQTRDLRHQLGCGAHRVSVVGADEDVALERVVEIAKRVSRAA